MLKEFFWFVGLFEGEGYIGISKGDPEICISMCDKDVMDRVSELLGKEHRSFVPKGKRVNGTDYLRQYRIQMAGRKAAYIIENIKPYMSERRQQKIEETLAAYKPKTTYKTEGYQPKTKTPVSLPFIEETKCCL
jgi:hypothetical protein